MAPLSQEQVARFQADMATVLAKHGLTAGYMVAEQRTVGSPTSEHCVVAFSLVEPNKPSPLIRELGLQTYEIVKNVSKVAVKISDN